MKRLRRCSVVFGAIALLLGATSAEASRAPTPTEQAGILEALDTDAECRLIRVSTVNAAWARADRLTAHGCFSDPATDILKRNRGVWEYQFAGGFGGPSTECGDEDASLPQPVAIDLRLCARPKPPTAANTSILCEAPLNPATDDPDDPISDSVRAPTRCNMRFGTGRQSGPNLAQLVWKRWGTDRSLASGFDVGFAPGARAAIPVRIAVYRLRHNECPGYTYTRIRIRWPDHTVLYTRPARCVV